MTAKGDTSGSEWGPFLLIIAVMAGGGYLLHFHGDALKLCVLWIKRPIALALDPLVGLDSTILHAADGDFRLLDWLSNRPPGRIAWSDLAAASAILGRYLMVPAAAALAWMAWRCGSRPISVRYRRSFTLDRLADAQSKVWPSVLPATVENPAEADRYAPALTPEEWLARLPGGRHPETGRLNEGIAAAAFAGQLLRPWRGFDALAPHEKALAAAFIARAQRRRSDSKALVDRINRVWVTRRGRGMAEAVAADRILAAYVARVFRSRWRQTAEATVASHAYCETAMVALLEWARREGGLLAPADFVWLRAVDRGLWYALGDLGRRSFHAESAGVHAHYKVERAVGRPLADPEVIEAVQGLGEYLHDNPR